MEENFHKKKPDAIDFPLDAIRRAETAMARRMAAATEAAERAETHIRSQVSTIKQEIESEGYQEGEGLRNHMIAEAKARAEMLTNEARKCAVSLQSQGKLRMNDAVLQAVAFIMQADEAGDT